MQYGQLTQQVHNLQTQVNLMDADLKALLALANQGKGAFWLGITMAGSVGAFATWLAERLIK